MQLEPAPLTPPERPLPGGRLAIDLLNTTWQGGEGVVDWLDYDEAVASFSASHHHPVPAADCKATRRELVKARKLIEPMFEARSLHDLDDDLLDAVDQALRSARTILDRSQVPTLRTTGDRPANAVAIEAIVDALDILDRKPDRVRRCEHEQCTLWFFDSSKGGRRRWCSMSTCGNRAKARRHYARSTREHS